MPTTSHQIQATAATFQSVVLEKSFSTPIILDFYAIWCGPCKTFGPILEKMAAAYHGAFLLAKIDIEQERELASTFRIRSVPTICLIKDGQVADAFPGALTEGQMKEFLLSHGIKPLEAAIKPDELDAVDPATTIALLQEKIAQTTDADSFSLKLDLALAFLQNHQADEANSLLEELPPKWAVDPRAVRAKAILRINAQQRALGSRHSLVATPHADDLRTWMELGIHDLSEGDYANALTRFIHILQRDRNYDNGRVRTLLIDAFAVIDDADLVNRYRRKMSAIIF